MPQQPTTMHRIYDAKLNKERVLLGPGDYFASCEPLCLHTVLGSCVSVCLWDEALRCGGMNHFMLPVAQDPETAFHSDTGRYGINAMELLINAMLRLGASRSRLVSKVFGGAHVLTTMSRRNPLPDSNAAFAVEYLQTEGIPIVARDLGGNLARQLRFLIHTGDAFVRKLGSGAAPRISERERSYRAALARPPATVEIFEPPPPSSQRKGRRR
ncbi:MAG: hypothetical protein ACOC1F_08150 [Myxococcota bacterium]